MGTLRFLKFIIAFLAFFLKESGFDLKYIEIISDLF